MLLRLNLIVAVFLAALFLLLFGSSNGSPPRMPEHNGLIFYTEKGVPVSSWYCKEVIPQIPVCYLNKTEHFHHLKTQGISGYWLGGIKQDVAVFPPTAGVEYKTDVATFNFPVYSMYSNLSHPKALIRIQQGPGLDEFIVKFEDLENKCSGISNETREQLHNFHLYANRKWNKYAYYLINNGNKMCIYTLKHEDLFQHRKPNNGDAQTIGHKEFHLINNFPKENYAPNFYCVDPIYGTFVMLYWNKQPGNPPQAHFYLINENDLQKFYLIDGIILKGFDEEALKAIFNNEFDKAWYPTFTSYGRQIFVWSKLPDNTRDFIGLWQNDEKYDAFYESLKDYRTIWNAKKSYIQYDKPVGRHDAPLLPPPITVSDIKPAQGPTLPPPTTPEVPTTAKKVTTVPPPTAAPSTPPPPTTSKATTTETMPPTTSMSPTAMTTAENTTSDSLNTTNNDTSSGQVTPSTAPATDNNGNAQPLEDNGPECDDKLFLYLLIVLIVIIVFEVIVLVILIILKSRGAKKMKVAMPRKKLSKSKSSIKKKPSPQAKKKKVKMPWAKESKKSISEKTAASKTEDAATGKTADEKTTTTHQTVDNYYTVGETFEKSSKKNKK